MNSLDSDGEEEKSELSILKGKLQQNKENREKEILTADTANEVRLTYMRTYMRTYINTYMHILLHTHTNIYVHLHVYI